MEIAVARPEHAAEIAAIYAPIVEATAISFETVPPDAQDFAQLIAEITERFPWLVALDEGAVAGYAYAHAHAFASRAAYSWSAETSIYVGESQRGRGVGRSLYSELLKILSELGYFRAFAGIALPNPASVALHEAVGFRAVGVYRKAGWKLGAWHDVGWWQCDLRTTDQDPAPPIAFRAAAYSPPGRQRPK